MIGKKIRKSDREKNNSKSIIDLQCPRNNSTRKVIRMEMRKQFRF